MPQGAERQGAGDGPAEHLDLEHLDLVAEAFAMTMAMFYDYHNNPGWYVTSFTFRKSWLFHYQIGLGARRCSRDRLP